MTIIINHSKKLIEKSLSDYALFIDEKLNLVSLKNIFSIAEISHIQENIKNSDLKKSILSFSLNSKKKNYFNKSKKRN